MSSADAAPESGVRLVRGRFSNCIYAVTKWRANPERGPDAWDWDPDYGAFEVQREGQE